MITVKKEELYEKLRNGKVIFEYQKRDGTKRGAIGTLKMELIPENLRPKDSSTSNTEYKNLRYFDFSKNAWRSISGEVKEVIVLSNKII